jgi:hypothetical protein
MEQGPALMIVNEIRNPSPMRHADGGGAAPTP